MNAILHWAEAVKTANPYTIKDEYAEEATLIGTAATEIAEGRREIHAYFNNFCATRKNPEVILGYTPDKVQWNGLTVVAKGEYDFVFEENGVRTHLPAFYTFVFERNPQTGEFKILHHHSSRMPEFPASPLDNQPEPSTADPLADMLYTPAPRN